MKTILALVLLTINLAGCMIIPADGWQYGDDDGIGYHHRHRD